MPAAVEPLTLAAFEQAAAAVDVARDALNDIATAGAKALDPAAFLADLAERYPDAPDAHALARRFWEACRADRRPTAVADALLLRLDGLAGAVGLTGERHDFAPAGFVATRGLYWEQRDLDFAGANGEWRERRTVAPAYRGGGRQNPQPQLAGLLPAEGLFAGGYVLGPAWVGDPPPFVSIAFVKRQTAAAKAHALEVQARREEAARQQQEAYAREQERKRLARPLTVADLEALRAEQRTPAGAAS